MLQIISGDADLPVKEDLGERRRKLEIQKTNKELANIGDSDENIEEAVVDEPEEDDFYKQAVLLKQAKEAAKQAKYSRYVQIILSRLPVVISLLEVKINRCCLCCNICDFRTLLTPVEEEDANGKRSITRQVNFFLLLKNNIFELSACGTTSTLKMMHS